MAWIQNLELLNIQLEIGITSSNQQKQHSPRSKFLFKQYHNRNAQFVSEAYYLRRRIRTATRALTQRIIRFWFLILEPQVLHYAVCDTHYLADNEIQDLNIRTANFHLRSQIHSPWNLVTLQILNLFTILCSDIIANSFCHLIAIFLWNLLAISHRVTNLKKVKKKVSKIQNFQVL